MPDHIYNPMGVVKFNYSPAGMPTDTAFIYELTDAVVVGEFDSNTLAANDFEHAHDLLI